MDPNIKSIRDALEWVDRDIEAEAACNGEMDNANAIRLGVIRNALQNFPERNCNRFKTWDEAEDTYWNERRAFLNSLPTAEERCRAMEDFGDLHDWLFAKQGELAGKWKHGGPK